ncbi:MAG: response regulator [Pseudohongiellaceae bacterium]
MSDRDILLVEDDEVFARVITRAMAHRNHTLHHATDADAVPALLKEQRFNWVILDLNLGGHSSLSLIPELKRHNPDITILVLTGYASIATAVEAIKLGASNYLAKPADADEILTALQTPSMVTNAPSEPEVQGRMSVRRLEWEHIQQVLKENHDNISETARQLGMHRRTLQRKLQKKPVAR